MAAHDLPNNERTREADSFIPDGNRANAHPLSGTFPPSLATLREHRGMDWAAIRAATAAQVPQDERERLIAEYEHSLELDRRRS